MVVMRTSSHRFNKKTSGSSSSRGGRVVACRQNPTLSDEKEKRQNIVGADRSFEADEGELAEESNRSPVEQYSNVDPNEIIDATNAENKANKYILFTVKRNDCCYEILSIEKATIC
ncbi:hypothetical protein RN001_008980 [Aquatica leii]|uniref:Uncharacterized protein n=1 Tax=Aquatica leii TaxID=1421715 RepID=A0AAN7PXZ4_9COLE|nr:hypothetical protein RN001_008980 [Aquatica leii]